MSDNKKYYYLKLKDNFFESDEIIALENMRDGYLYSNIFLKMLCKSDYCERGYRAIVNKFYSSGIDNLTYISLIVRMDKKAIKSSLPQLKKSKLLKEEKGLIILRDLSIDLERNRGAREYKEWRKKIFERDNYTCQICNKRGVKLNAHHKKKWADCSKSRYITNNGITLCVDCHRGIHSRNEGD